MSKIGFKPISNIVDEVVNHHLPRGDINAQSNQLKRINICWPRCSGNTITQNIKPIRLIDDTLIVQTHSPIWANKMRYLIKPIIKKLHNFGFDEIKKINIKINPKSSPTD